MADTGQNSDLEELDFLKESAEEIYAQLESLGEDWAKKVKRLRHIVSRVIKIEVFLAMDVARRYYSQFEGETLRAIQVYLRAEGHPVAKPKVLSDISRSGVFEKKILRDSIDFQTKPGNNGRRMLFDDDGMISLTAKGAESADRLIAEFGSPPTLPSPH